MTPFTSQTFVISVLSAYMGQQGPGWSAENSRIGAVSCASPPLLVDSVQAASIPCPMSEGTAFNGAKVLLHLPPSPASSVSAYWYGACMDSSTMEYCGVLLAALLKPISEAVVLGQQRRRL